MGLLRGMLCLQILKVKGSLRRRQKFTRVLLDNHAQCASLDDRFLQLQYRRFRIEVRAREPKRDGSGGETGDHVSNSADAF